MCFLSFKFVSLLFDISVCLRYSSVLDIVGHIFPFAFAQFSVRGNDAVGIPYYILFRHDSSTGGYGKYSVYNDNISTRTCEGC